jgi:hypothetical protein
MVPAVGLESAKACARESCPHPYLNSQFFVASRAKPEEMKKHIDALKEEY